MIEPPKGEDLLAAIHYVRDFYRNAARMLRSADEPLGERSYTWWGKSWKPIPHVPRDINRPGRWLPHFVIRQYKFDEQHKEVLTLAVLPHDPIEPTSMTEPWCLASRLVAKATPDQIYWVSLLQMRTKNGLSPAGHVVRVNVDDLKPKPTRLKYFQEIVANDELLSVAVPLVEIGDVVALVGKLLDPLLGTEFTVR